MSLLKRREWLLLGVGVVGAAAFGVAACVGPEPILPVFDAATPDVSTCNAPQTVCGTTCTTLSNDPLNCGMCGKACGMGSTCVSGTCTAAETLCTSDAGAPYYANLATDNANCGACGNACPSPEWCVSGHCYAKNCADLQSEVGAKPVGGADAAVLLPDGGAFPDGTYTIDPDGTGPIKPFAVYCAGMNTQTPKEYLTLVHTALSGEPGSNFSSIGPNGACSCSSSPTYQFTRVHINPSTLTIDVNDHTFAFLRDTSVIACWSTQGGACGGQFKNPQYGVAWDCSCGGRGGFTNVDLRGTGFTIDPSVVYGLQGAGPQGTGSVDDAGDMTVANGGGCCGGEYPEVMTDAGAVVEIVLKQN